MSVRHRVGRKKRSKKKNLSKNAKKWKVVLRAIPLGHKVHCIPIDNIVMLYLFNRYTENTHILKITSKVRPSGQFCFHYRSIHSQNVKIYRLKKKKP